MSDDTWDDVFFSELGPVIKQSNSKDNDIELCNEADYMYSKDADVVEVEHSITVNTYSDAIKALRMFAGILNKKAIQIKLQWVVSIMTMRDVIKQNGRVSWGKFLLK